MQPRNPQHAQGIDVSWYQGIINWPKVKAAGYSFAIIKCTEGETMKDARFETNLAGAVGAGMAVGAYHFLRAESPVDAKREALAFCSVLDSVGGIGSLHIPPVLDVEFEPKASTDFNTIIRVWAGVIQEKYGVKPIVYSYPWYIGKYFDTTLAADFPLWLADYSGNPPADRAGWKEWTFLQYTHQGQVPGISGYVDLNEYAGSVEELLYKLSAEDANKIIARWLAHEYDQASEADKEERHRLANELRKASGQSVQ